ncbi:MAG: tRNA (adenosine(37)-N6)-dimethylallyltransferase MiaA [Acidobacteria bacterium]|nr:tRNA (adenosine(37)-N6)-dimethylallyltransferase MiaA [Acidobacteriota bacterium]
MTRLVAVVGPTASGKTALGVALASAFGGEVVSCDSTAVYRGLDIGTDKPTEAERRAIPHHLIDVAAPTEIYSAARYAADAAAAIHDIAARGRLPIVVGGTGFYFRALTRGLFAGPARDERIRRRLERVAERRGTASLHRWLTRVDSASGRRVLPGDRKRIVRALEVYLLTGRPLTDHFGETRSPLGAADVCAIGLRVSRALQLARVARRVDEQFARGVVAEVQRLIAAGVPPDAHAFSGLVYRQILDLLAGVRDEAATRALIVRENMRYAKRQMTWFRKEPGVTWLDAEAGGDAAAAIQCVGRWREEKR